jgi:(1->4)-alpha-D-glucan 1-alpha-D-glucosylmutase
VLKYTGPGVPDLYQGAELWDLSLVDPDNRRPVDYALRRKLLEEMKGMDAAGVLARMDDGLPKLFVVHQCLLLRREHPGWFGAEAGYTPVAAEGSKAEHVVAYLRGDHVMTIVPRLPLSLGGDWDGTTVEIPAGEWRNRFTGERITHGAVDLATLLKGFPVAVLVRD